jgi:hypothetical protein
MPRASDARILREWLALPARLGAAVSGLRATQLDARRSPQSLSPRETVHHLVEANVIASSILLAALATDGGPYDWTWVWPNGAWMKRMGYDRAPVGTAIPLLRAIGRHFEVLIEANPGAMRRKVTLFDTPEGKRYRKTVAQVLATEVAHAEEHLGDLPARSRVRRRPVRAASRTARRS